MCHLFWHVSFFFVFSSSSLSCAEFFFLIFFSIFLCCCAGSIPTAHHSFNKVKQFSFSSFFFAFLMRGSMCLWVVSYTSFILYTNGPMHNWFLIYLFERRNIYLYKIQSIFMFFCRWQRKKSPVFSQFPFILVMFELKLRRLLEKLQFSSFYEWKVKWKFKKEGIKRKNK